MKTYVAILALATTFASPALAQDSRNVALASVAHQLGLTYAYLGPDDMVSLGGNGISVTVRPGYPFFYVNDRSEPVAGGAPVYRGGDIYVSRAFVKQLSAIERSAATADPGSMQPAQAPAMRGEIGLPKANAVPRRVTEVHIAAVEGTEDVLVTGKAAPGSLVALVLKAVTSPLVPVVFINRSFALATPDGSFSTKISTAPQYFQGSYFIVEASGIDDATPQSARYTPAAK